MPTEFDLRVAANVRCELGEGPIWHPARETLIWFDIHAQVLFECDGRNGPIRAIGFGERISAAALTDGVDIVVASASGLVRLDLSTEDRTLLLPLEAGKSDTRTNDARVGPNGAFWVGTMGFPFAEGVGSLYHCHHGRADLIRSGLTVPNSLAFSPDGKRAYFSDTFDHRILVYDLDPHSGAPTAEPDLFIDLSAEKINPDGSVVDVEGCLWNAQYGAGRVVRYRPDGRQDQVIELPVSQPTCPAFGGDDLKTLFVTSAWGDLSDQDRANQPLAGAVFAVDLDVPGLPERRMRLADWEG